MSGPRSEYEKQILRDLRFAEMDTSEYHPGSDGYQLNPPGMTFDSSELRTSELGIDLESRDLNVFDKIAISNYRGYAKLIAGAASLPASGLELLGVIDKGSVNSMGMAFERHLQEQAPPQTGLGYSLIEGISQFLVPGVGYYKLFGMMTKLKGFDNFLGAALKGSSKEKYAKIATRLFGTEFATTMTAQTPTDPNFIGFMTDIFGLDEETSTLMQNEIFNSIASPAQDWEAESVFREKLEAVPGDMAIAVGFDLAVEVGVQIIKTFRNVKKKQDEIEGIIDDEAILPDELVQSNAAKFSEDVYEPLTREQEDALLPGLMQAIRDGKEEGGFSITLDGKSPFDLGYEGGYMVAPLKETELKFESQTITTKQMREFLRTVDRLRVTAKGRYSEIYAGGWIDNNGMYVLDASVRVDNLDDALYIARAGNQDAIFDLKEFDEIDTKQGIKKLKEDRLYKPSEQLKRIRETKSVRRGFKETGVDSNRRRRPLGTVGGTI